MATVSVRGLMGQGQTVPVIRSRVNGIVGFTGVRKHWLRGREV